MKLTFKQLEALENYRYALFYEIGPEGGEARLLDYDST